MSGHFDSITKRVVAMISAILMIGLLQVDPIASDNSAIITCLNGRLAGLPSKCQSLSSEVAKDYSAYDKIPVGFYILGNYKAANETSPNWRYKLPGEQLEFRNSIIKRLEIPFSTWRISDRTNGHDGSIRINRMIDGIFDNFDRVTVGVNYGTGRITSVHFEMRSEVIHETETITDKMVFDKIKQDGEDYEVVSDQVQWDPISIHTSEMLSRGAKVTSNGKVMLVKQRIVAILRNDISKRYVFRMDGTLSYSE